MTKELEHKLREAYPLLFKDLYGPIDETCMHWGIECSDGWYILLNKLCSVLQTHINWRNGNVKYGGEPVTQVVFDQIKEKFGKLSIYYSGGDANCAGIIQMAESISSHICEKCGASGESIGVTHGWITTLCSDCAEEIKRPILLYDEFKFLHLKPNVCHRSVDSSNTTYSTTTPTSIPTFEHGDTDSSVSGKTTTFNLKNNL